jgi:uncharacterized membrane protein YgdD (TMEM256/DUF423 family)
VKTFAVLGAINAFVGVAAGAFGAHALRRRVSPDLLAVFETGTRYHMFAALGLFVAAWAVSRGDVSHASIAGWLMAVGIVLFSGSLYALTLTGIRGFGAVTPVGGAAFLVAWAILAWGFARM